MKSALESFPAIQFLIKIKEKGDATCHGLLLQMNNVHFLSILYVLKDVLPILDTLSKMFQQSTVNFSSLTPEFNRAKTALEDVAAKEAPIKEFMEDLKEGGKMAMLQYEPTEHQIKTMRNKLTKYVGALTRNIDDRFENTLPILASLDIFDPTLLPSESDEFKTYGNDSIKKLGEHYYPEQVDRLQAEWNILKFHMKEWLVPYEIKEGRKSTPSEWCLKHLLKQRNTYSTLLPLIMNIAEIVLTMPISNAWPERGASKMKLIKTRLRSRLNNEMLGALLQISINGPAINTKECNDLIKKTNDK